MQLVSRPPLRGEWKKFMEGVAEARDQSRVERRRSAHLYSKTTRPLLPGVGVAARPRRGTLLGRNNARGSARIALDRRSMIEDACVQSFAVKRSAR